MVLAAAASVGSPAAPAWGGAPLVPLAASVAPAVALWFLCPHPAGVTSQAWALFSVFVSAVAGLVLRPLPSGAWALVCLTFTVASGILPFQAAFQAFTSDVIWLIVLAFFFARSFVNTGLSERVANTFIQLLGKSTLSLSYGLVLSEALLAPAMPSTTARAGGVYLPIIRGVAEQNDSRPGPTSRRLGAFLIQAQLQASAHSSAMFMTAAAQNMLSLKLAGEAGVVLAGPWLLWFKASCVPALVGLLATPLLVYYLYPPEIKETPEAPAEAARTLEKMGPLSGTEKLFCGSMGLTVFLWIFGDKFGVSSVVAAMIGLSLQLVVGAVAWKDCLAETPAWDTLLWFAVLIGMSSQLNALGFIPWIASTVNAQLAALSLGWGQAFLLLHAIFFAVHYLYASQTAQVASLTTAVLGMMLAAGAPPVLCALSMAFHPNLFGGLSHYASGQAASYFGSGYCDVADGMRVGGIMGVFNFLVYAVVGGLWWKAIGLF